LKFFGSRTNGTFGFAPTAQADTQAKPKARFFCQRTDINSYFATMFLTMQGALRDALKKEEV